MDKLNNVTTLLRIQWYLIESSCHVNTHILHFLLPLLSQKPEIELVHDGLRSLRLLNVMYSLM